MKFVCENCATKYSIADERVRGRVLKIRCKKCDFVITVREDVEAALVELPSPAAAGPSFDAAGENEQTMVGDLASMSAKASGAEDDDWYVSFDGEQEGPFSLARAIERVRAEQRTEKEAHAWRPGFLVWLPVEEVPELNVALQRAPMARPPVRAMTPTPIAPLRGGAIPPGVPKNPSGPRAALSVNSGAIGGARQTLPAPGLTGKGVAPTLAAPAPILASPLANARLDLRKSSAPPIPAAARVDAPSVASSTNPPGKSSEDMFALAAKPEPAPEPDKDDHDAMPDLAISNEASGLVNLAHLAASAMGKPVAGQAFINGHTGRQAKYNPEPLAALEPHNASVSAPVVVVSGPAQGGTSPLFKWAALVTMVACLGLGAGVIYLLTHRPPPDTIIVTEPSRHTDDSPITMSDPGGNRNDPQAQIRKGVWSGAKKLAVGKVIAPVAPAVPAKPGDALSGSQRALANLYKDDNDRVMPHEVPGAGSARGGGGGQVSNAAIIAVVGANKRTLGLCYERALKHDQSLKSGRVPIQVSVGMSGRVTSVTIAEQQYAGSELGQCFVQAVKRWNFPASDSAYATEFPFILQGQ